MNSPFEERVDLADALAAGIGKAAEERLRDRRARVPVTHHFASFGSKTSIAEYEDFFKSLGITASRVVQNQKSYVYFQVDRAFLRARAYSGFTPGDRIRFVFTVDTQATSHIQTFEVVLLNSDTF